MKLWVILWKEALSEARGLERVPTLALFSTTVLLTLHFAVPPSSAVRAEVASGFLWAVVVFSAMLELRRSFDSERRDGTLDGLRAAPVDPVLLYVAKGLSSLVVLAVLEALLVPAAAPFFGGRASAVPAAYGVALLGTAGLVAWGTLFAVVAGESRASEVLLPVLLFPLLVPQTIAAVRLLGFYLAGVRLQDPATGFLLLASFDALSVGTSIMLFGYVLDE